MNESFVLMLEELGLHLSEEQLNQFDIYYRELVDWNEKLNLTSITERPEVYSKHFYDSLCLIKAKELHDESILDVGSGAGFPSIPLKIVFPHLNITIIDATQKRIQFLGHLCKRIGLRARLIHGRIEEFPERESYDIVTARAVANLQMLSELCIPFVKLDGYFLAMKGPQYVDELNDAVDAIDILGGTVEDVIEYQVEDFERSILRIKKTKPTPEKYPRKYKKIKSKPL